MKKIFLGSDHVSIHLKEAVISYLQAHGVDYVDMGPFSSEVTVDYPDYAQVVARAVAAGECDGGIVICGTGLGASMAANKVKGVRAALCHDPFTAHQARAHNNANVLAMGAWIISPERMPGIVKEWLETPYEGGRHTVRLRKLDRYLEEPRRKGVNAGDPNEFQFAMALSVRATSFGPVLFSGDLANGLAALRQEGFRFVELSIREVEDLPMKRLTAWLQQHDMKVSALATGQGCLQDHLCLCSADPEIHKKAIRRMKVIIDYARQIDCPVIIGGVRGRLSGSERDQAAQQAMLLEGVKELGLYARKQGVSLLLEAINRYETNVLNTAEQVLNFIDQVEVPEMKVLLDTFHMNIEETDPSVAIQMAGERLGYLHMADSNRMAPGQGHIHFAEIFRSLQAIQFRGVISAEILPLPDDRSAVAQTANYLRSIGVRLESHA